MTAVDRLAQGYQPDFDIDLEVGRQGELYVAGVFDAIKSGASCEVKTDAMAVKTGNVYIEHECLKRGRWEPSGIAATFAELWAVVVGSEVLVSAATWRWRYAHKWAIDRHMTLECRRGTHPTRGARIPLARLVSLLAEPSLTGPGGIA